MDKSTTRQKEVDESAESRPGARQNRNDFFKSLKKKESSPVLDRNSGSKSPECVQEAAKSDPCESSPTAIAVSKATAAAAAATVAAPAATQMRVDERGATDPNMLLKMYTTEGELALLRSLGWDE